MPVYIREPGTWVDSLLPGTQVVSQAGSLGKAIPTYISTYLVRLFPKLCNQSSIAIDLHVHLYLHIVCQINQMSSSYLVGIQYLHTYLRYLR